MRRKAIFLPATTSADGNCFCSFRKGGMLSSMCSVENRSSMVKPLSAIIEMPGLSYSFSKNPLSLVNSTSDIEPTKTGGYKADGTIRVASYYKFNSIIVLVL